MDWTHTVLLSIEITPKPVTEGHLRGAIKEAVRDGSYTILNPITFETALSKEIGELILFVEEEIIKKLHANDKRSAEDLIIWYASWNDAVCLIDDNEKKDIATMIAEGLEPKTLEDFDEWYCELDPEDQADQRQYLEEFYLNLKEVYNK